MSVLSASVKSAIDTGFYPVEIGQSCRFNDDDSPKLTRTFAAGNRRKWRIFGWVKLGNLNTLRVLFSATITPASTEEYLGLNSDNTFRHWSGATGGLSVSAPVYRDPNSWFFLDYTYDSENATQADRGILKINGVRQTMTTEAISLNRDSAINNNVAHAIGGFATIAGSHNDGYLADLHFTGGVITGDASQDKNGVRIPDTYAGSYGTNGFHLDFADNLNIGNDVSGNNNDWTPVNLVSSDIVLDSPTQNWCTLSNLDTPSASLSQGNLLLSTGAIHRIRRGTLSASAIDKNYFEMRITGGTSGSSIISIGLCRGDINFASTTSSLSGFFGAYVSDAVYIYNDITLVTTIPITGTAGDIFKAFYDSLTGELWIGRNNDWYDSSGGTTGNPSSGLNPTIVISGSPEVFPCTHNYNNNCTMNFGQDSTFAGSTTAGNNTDANGRGDFKYPVPAGALALCCPNLPEPADIDGDDFFISEIDTEANIESKLLTARSGWTDYVDILKNRSSVESWAWRFSHDPTNEYAVAVTSTYQTKRTLSGTDSWLAHSLRIGADYGTGAGSQAHTTGVATTITHNLANANCMIFLFSRTGSNVFVHHPALTVGNLLYLNTNNGEFASTAITNITANSFDIGSAAGTDTYDWLVITDTHDLVSMGAYQSIASTTEGAFAYNGHTPDLVLGKYFSAGLADWITTNEASDTDNVVSEYLTWNTSGVEASFDWLDRTANGFKIRGGNIGVTATYNIANYTGDGFMYLTLGKTPFKYANAR